MADENSLLEEEGRNYFRAGKSAALPTFNEEDLALGEKVLGNSLHVFSHGFDLYRKGMEASSLKTATAGLRLFTQFILEGGHRLYTSPWMEYESLAEAYWAIGKAFKAKAYLEIAFTAYKWCYSTIYSEPSTASIERNVAKKLALLRREISAFGDV